MEVAGTYCEGIYRRVKANEVVVVGKYCEGLYIEPYDSHEVVVIGKYCEGIYTRVTTMK